MATMKTTAKTNPITGMASNNNPRQEARQEKRQVRKEERALNKSLNEGIKKQKVDKSVKTISYRGTPVDTTPKQKDWRDKVKPDKGGKKNMSTTNPNKKGKGGFSIVPKSCRGPKEWTR